MLWIFETPFSLRAKEFLAQSKLMPMKPTAFTLSSMMTRARLQQPYDYFLTIDLTQVTLQRMAVLDDYQGQGLGSILLKEAEDFAQEQGFKSISLHAQLGALKFYLNNGYQEVGQIFEEAGIQHITVEKSLISKKA